MRVALYARYSSEKQADGYTIESQIETCRKHLESKGAACEIVEYIDRAKSGTTQAGRAALMRLQGDAANGLLNRLIVYKFDRLGRNLVDTATTIRDLEEVGVEIVSATEGNDRMARGMHLVIAEDFSRQLGERTLAGTKKAAEAGRIGGPAPYGYVRDKAGQFKVDRSKARIVRRIFKEYLNCKSFRTIAEELNVDQIPSPSGGQWGYQTLQFLLSNSTYIGQVIYNQRTLHRSRKTGRRICRKRPREQWMVFERPDLRIVTAKTWAAAQARRKRRTHLGAECHRKYALSGVVRCAACGHAFTAQPAKNKHGRRYVYMACGARVAGKSCENTFRFREDYLSGELVRQLAGILFAAEAVESLKGTVMRLALERLASVDTEAAETGETIRACERRITHVMKLMLQAEERGDGTKDLWAAELAEQNMRRRRLEKRGSELAQRQRPGVAVISRLVDQAIERQREGLLEIHKPEPLRHALQLLTGGILAHPDRRLTYETSPARVLMADGAIPQFTVETRGRFRIKL